MERKITYRIRAVKILSGILGVLLLINATGIVKPPALVSIVYAMDQAKLNNPYGKILMQEKNHERIELAELIQGKVQARVDKAEEQRLKEKKALEDAKKAEEEKNAAEEKAKEEEKKAKEKKENEKVIETFNDTVWATTTLNYREGPGESYKKIGTLKSGEEVQRTGLTQNGWVEINIDGKKYYVHGDYVSEEEPKANDVETVTVTYNLSELQAYAFSLFPEHGWGEENLDALIQLVYRESGWNPLAENPSSFAYGLGQALPASKMAPYGDDYLYNGETQLRWMMDYIENRYGSPNGAWAFWQANGWY